MVDAVVGTTIAAMDGNVRYSPEFRSRGQGAIVVINVTQASSTVGLGFTLQTRNRDETSFTDLDSVDAPSTGTVTKNVASGIKQICRLEYQFAAGAVANDRFTFTARVVFRPYA